MEMTIEEFRTASEKRKKMEGRKPAPYTEEQKKFAVQFATEQLETGMTKAAVAKSLGISDMTIRKWLDPEQKRFRRVQVVDGAAKQSSLVVVMPNGIRVEGLDLNGAVSLLRSLR
jgi:predicted transcriptional regulator